MATRGRVRLIDDLEVFKIVIRKRVNSEWAIGADISSHHSLHINIYALGKLNLYNKNRVVMNEDKYILLEAYYYVGITHMYFVWNQESVNSITKHADTMRSQCMLKLCT